MTDTRPTYRITDLEATERPRERLRNLGAQALSSAELLAILLRVGVHGENAVQVGQRLINTFHGLSGLHRASFAEVCDQRCIGEAKAAQIKAAIEAGPPPGGRSPQGTPGGAQPAGRRRARALRDERPGAGGTARAAAG